MDDRAGDGLPGAVPVAQTRAAEAEDQLGSERGGESRHQAGSSWGKRHLFVPTAF